MEGYIYKEIGEERILLSKKELSRRLQSPLDRDEDQVREAERGLRAALSCRFCAVRLPLAYPAGHTVSVGPFSVESRDLYKNLFPCQEAFLLAVTLGEGVDRYLQRLSLFSVSGHFVADAVASALAEAAADLAEEELRGQLSLRPRFSPGYGDMPLSFQESLLSLTDAPRRLGIKLGRSLLLSPQKTITAIMGILP